MENKSTNKPPAELPLETELSSAGDSASKGSSSPAAGPNEPASAVGPPDSGGRFRKVFGRHNIYLLVLAGLILIAIAGIVGAVKVSRNNSGKTKTTSLTSEQLSGLKGSATVVGDSQQLLDIQSNSVFEGQVLLRNNLEVAGGLKVGGALSLPSVTVGGTSTLGQVAVNGSLSVAGATTLQKGLTVAGGASFAGAVSAGQLSVSSLQLTGDLLVNRHITVGGGLPSKTANGSALGSGGTISLSGSDTAGSLTINTGGSPPAGCFGTFNFAQRFNTTPHVVISPSNSSAASLEYYTNRSATSFSLCTVSAPAASTTYVFDFVAID